MKKIPFIIAICLSLTLSGCALNQPEYHSNIITKDPTVETTNNNELNITYEQLPMTAVSLPVTERITKASDGTEICKTYEQSITLVVSDPEVADKIIVDFLNRVDIEESVNNLTASAKIAYDANPKNWTPYLTQVSYSPARIDQSILSLTGSRITYDGLPHPEVTYSSITYDLVTGNVLTLNDIMIDKTNAGNLCESIIKALKNQHKTPNSLYEEFEKTVQERFNKSLSYDQGWHFSTEGLVVYFSPYEIAPYSLGVVSVTIPYNQLSGVVKDEYFPREQDVTIGTVKAELFNQDDLDRFTQFAEVVIQQDKDKVVLFTEQAVSDLTLQTGNWSKDGAAFTAEHTVFAAATLTPGDAIMVEADFAESQQTLLLNYKSNGETISVYLSIDTTSGDVKLEIK